ncbi:MAG: metal-dependent hydrolase [Verrucomicrobia bacterium]|nr:metal-dependent hydrolase [Verrucomicrobiota bacterium]
MKLTYYGHACFSVKVAGKDLLFDPFIRHNPLASAIDVDSIPADYILVSHGHADHLSEAVEIAKRTGATVISNYEVCEWLGKQGAPKLHHLNHGGSARLDFGRVKYVWAVHSSSLPDGSNGGNPGGFVVETGEGNFYYSGDTALTGDMKLIGETTPLRFAVFPIGDTFTMGVDDAVKAADFVRVNKVVGVHYDTFPPIAINKGEAAQKFKAAGKELVLVKIGGSVEL